MNRFSFIWGVGDRRAVRVERLVEACRLRYGDVLLDVQLFALGGFIPYMVTISSFSNTAIICITFFDLLQGATYLLHK